MTPDPGNAASVAVEPPRLRLLATIVSVLLVLAACTGGTDTAGLDSDNPLTKGGDEVEAVLGGDRSDLGSDRAPVEAGDSAADGSARAGAGSDQPSVAADAEADADGVAAPRSVFADQIQSIGSAPTLSELPSLREGSGPVPQRLQLPTLGVADAPVTSVGVEPNGDMEIPGAREVGWYRYGPTPGDGGSSVLAAHIAFNGVDGVFRSLAQMAPGDVFSVDYDDGSSRDFIVVGLRQYSKIEAPLDELFDRSGPPRLVLITCGGRFNRSLDSYDDNVVVVSVPLNFDFKGWGAAPS